MRRLIATILAAAMLLGVAVAPAAAATDDTIADIAVANGNFTTLVAALSCTGLVPSTWRHRPAAGCDIRPGRPASGVSSGDRPLPRRRPTDGSTRWPRGNGRPCA